MQDQLNQIIDLLIKTGMAVVTGLIIWAGAWATAWFKAHTKNTEESGLNNRIKDAAAVGAAASKQLIASKTQGPLDLDTARAAKAYAVETARAILSSDDLAAMKTSKGLTDAQVTSVIGDHVEAEVLKEKVAAPSEPAATAGAVAVLAANDVAKK